MLVESPERRRLREVLQRLARVRDAIAEEELELEALRERLGRFEAAYRARLAPEHGALRRIELLVGHFDRCVELLRDEKPPQVRKRHRRIEARRQRELRERADEPQEEDEELLASAPRPNETLKQAYRALARKFHPDLARSEAERLRFGELMTRINQLYQTGDLDGLIAMQELAHGDELDGVGDKLEEQLAQLEERLRAFDSALANLRDERADLERSATCELLRNVEQAQAAGRDLVEELRGELRQRIDRSYIEIRHAARRLEHQVSRYNKDAKELDKQSDRGLLYKFDPYADKRLVRLGLDDLEALASSKEAKAEAVRLEALGDPALIRLLFFTYIAELSPLPLPGLETYDDLRLRFDALHAEEEPAQSLEQTLVAGDALVEFGLRKATEKAVRMGLRFRSQTTREAMPVLLRSLTLRRELKKILGVLGEHTTCEHCTAKIFAVPLFKTRGLDDLRALVCPSCGAILRSYWMPKGKDVQAVLNAAFLDFELVSEWAFKLSRASIAAQLLPLQVERMTMGELRARLHKDVFARYAVPIAEEQLEIVLGKKVIAPKTPLADLERQAFRLRFKKGAEIKEAAALELLRHRIRNRFNAQGDRAV